MNVRIWLRSVLDAHSLMKLGEFAALSGNATAGEFLFMLMEMRGGRLVKNMV